MQAEIQRVLELVQSGRLTTEQGAAMIAALREAPPMARREREHVARDGSDVESERESEDELDTAHTKGPQAGAEAAARGTEGCADARWREGSRRGHRRHRHRHHRSSAGFDFEGLGRDFGRAMGRSAKSLHRVLGAGFLSHAEEFLEGTNDAVLSRADAPEGTDFVCERNRLVVSSLKRLSLTRSTFADNELDAASIDTLELIDARVTGLALRGASLKGGLIERASLENLELNGARLANVTLADGKFADSLLNGAQVRDLGIARSHVEASRLNAAKLKTVLITADSRVVRLVANAVLGRDWLIDDSVLAGVSMSGLRVDGLRLKRAGLEDVSFEVERFSADLDPRGLGLMRDVSFERVVLKRCRFIDCRFDGAQFAGFEAEDLTFRGVDFGATRVESAAALARFAATPDHA